MAVNLRLIAFLLLLSQVSSIDGTLEDWLLISSNYKLGGFHSANANLAIGSNGPISSPLESYAFYNTGQVLWLTGDFSTSTSSLLEYAVGFWVKFDWTVSDQVFQFGDPSGYHYIVSSSKSGTLDVTYYQDSTKTDSQDNFSINVPLSKWFCIVFDFVSGSPATVKIAISNSAIVTKTSDASSSAPFQLPSGILTFGKSVYAAFFEAFVSNSFSQADPLVINVIDESGTEFAVTSKCDDSYNCYDDVCSATGLCFTSYFMCKDFDNEQNCLACPSDSLRDTATACQTCITGYSFKDHNCNFYLGCLDANNCETCYTSSTICDACNSTSFLYDIDDTSTMCICKVYVACEWSCNSCNPGPECYECASIVSQEGSSCRVDKVGFQISLEGSNIIIDFAHPLTAKLTKSSLKATSNSMADISTDGWTLNGCSAYSMQCKIITSNVFESDLPIDLAIEFNTAIPPPS